MLLINCELNGQILINEFLASNTHTNINQETGIFSDWIELYNYSKQNINIGDYYLTDNKNSPQKWSFPINTIIEAESYLLVYADKSFTGLHTNFGLSRDGEEICLYNPLLMLIDEVSFNQQLPDVSFGRQHSNLESWLYFGKPTPGYENITEGYNNKTVSSNVIFSLPGGFYNSPQIIKLDVLENDVIIKYTTDGSIPDEDSHEYRNTFSIDTTTVLRARCYKNGKLPGPVISQTYFINEKRELPVFSISIDPYYLWDEEFGIYVDGSSFNGSRLSRNCCKKDWERPMHIEFFESDGSLAFQSDAGLEVKGRQNCEFPRKPLGIYFKGKYGQNEISHKIFNEKDIELFRSFVLRPGGADGIGNLYNGTMFRDGLLGNMLIGKMDIDYVAFRPAILYINGQYWGIHNIRERIKADFIHSNHNVNPNMLDILENPSNGGVFQGDDLHYSAMLNFLRTNNLSVQSNYEYIKTQVDINEFINYQIAEIFVNNEDWANNNVQCWRPKTDEGIWRWIFYDVEGGFGLYSDEDYKNNQLNFSQDDFLKHKWLFSKFLDNQEFKSEFVQRFASHLNTTFSSERILQLIEVMKQEIEDEMPYDINRWGGKTTIGGGEGTCLESIEDWNTNIEIMREFARQRPYWIKKHLKSYFNLEGEITLTINSENGKVKVNGLIAPDTSLFFKGLQIRLEAIPDIGYRFVKWEGISKNQEIFLDTNSDIQIKAIFESTSEIILPAIIDEELFLNIDGSPYLAPGDITITDSGSLIVEAGVEIRMPDNASIYDYGKFEIRGEEGLAVIIKGNSAIEMDRWGAVCVIDAVSDAIFSYLIIEDASRGGLDPLKYHANISVVNSTIHLDHIHINNSKHLPFYSEFSNVYIAYSEFYSSAVCDYVNVTNTESAIIENCIFSGNDADDVDGIDYDFVEGGIIRNNYFSGFSGFNSDGIDIGESHNILVENNIIHDISDKGISIGLGSTTRLVRNIIYNCTQGVGIKDEGSYALIDHNTFYNNVYAVACFEKSPGMGGGSAEIINSILSGSSIASFFSDEYSSLVIKYSLSDTDDFHETGNISGNPMFRNPGTGNFELLPASPCIDSGDSDSEYDPDGSRSDIGAIPFNHNQIWNLHINEVFLCDINCENYNNSWLEIYNSSKESINIAGLYLSMNPENLLMTQIPGNESGNLFLNASSFIRFWTSRDPAISNLNINIGANPSGGKYILTQLLDNNAVIIDSLQYPKPINGKSFGRYPDGSSNLEYFNEPTSGSFNIPDSGPEIRNLFINEFLASNSSDTTDKWGDYDDWFEIYNAGPDIVDLGGLYFSDNRSNLVQYKIPTGKADSTTICPGEFMVFWADNDSEQGITHLDFRLDGGGEYLSLVQVNGFDTILIDSVSYGTQIPDISSGRYPDGSSNWMIMDSTTPGKSNISTGIIQIKNNLSVNIYPNPAREEINIMMTSQGSESLLLEIFNNFGVLVYSEPFRISGKFFTKISTINYSEGVYYLKLSSGISYSIKKLIIF